MTWTEEQRNNAAVIYRVGLQLGASVRDIQVAIMAAIVESGLKNVDYGDRDSIGMFQQRDAWGSRSARLDPYQSSRMFFLGGAAGQQGLLDIANRDARSLGSLAQDVQVSAYPDRYAEHQSEALGLLQNIDPDAAPPQGGGGRSLGDVPGVDEWSTVPTDDAQPDFSDFLEVDSADNLTAEDGITALGTEGGPVGPLDALQFGESSLGSMQPVNDPQARFHMPPAPGYAPSGGGGGGFTYTGPSLSSLGVDTGSGSEAFPGVGGAASGWRAAVIGAAKKMLGTPYVWGGTSYSGVDCSGLIQLLYNKQGFSLPRISADQARSGKQVPLDKLQPGDLVAWDNSSRNNGADHIAIYIGGGKIIEAPRPGGVVQVSNLYDTGEAWGVAFARDDGSSKGGSKAPKVEIPAAIDRARKFYRTLGINMPATDFALLDWEHPTLDPDKIEPGQVVAWENDSDSGTGHFGVYLGGSQFIEARAPGAITDLSVLNGYDGLSIFPKLPTPSAPGPGSTAPPPSPFPNGTSSEPPPSHYESKEPPPMPGTSTPSSDDGGGGGGGGRRHKKHSPYESKDMPPVP